LDERHRWQSRPPALAPGCEAGGRHDAPSIVSPPAGQVMVLLPGVPAERQEIPLQAESFGPETRLSWFVDGEYQGSALAEQRLWWTPSPGRHELLVLDDAGLTARRVLEVHMR
jgi:penicillin-binding protein 1C